MTDARERRRHAYWTRRWLLGLALGGAVGLGIGLLRDKALMYLGLGAAIGGAMMLATGRGGEPR